MQIHIFAPATTDKRLLAALETHFPDIHEDSWDASEGFDYYLGKSSDDDVEDDDGKPQHESWLTHEDAIEYCGFAEGLIPDAIATIEGNGSWAQGMLRQGGNFENYAFSDAERADRIRAHGIWQKGHAAGKALAVQALFLTHAEKQTRAAMARATRKFNAAIKRLQRPSPRETGRDHKAKRHCLTAMRWHQKWNDLRPMP